MSTNRCMNCGAEISEGKTLCYECWVGANGGPVEDMEVTTKYLEDVIAICKHQVAKGKEKYGVTLDENTTLSRDQRLEHIQEELVDALFYTAHMRAVLDDGLTANDYQRMCLRTAGEDESVWLDNAIMGLCGEAGECADIVKKYRFHGHALDKNSLVKEAGDVLWYVALLCSALGFSMSEVMEKNIEKLKKRYPDGFDKNRSINRAE